MQRNLVLYPVFTLVNIQDGGSYVHMQTLDAIVTFSNFLSFNQSDQGFRIPDLREAGGKKCWYYAGLAQFSEKDP